MRLLAFLLIGASFMLASSFATAADVDFDDQRVVFPTSPENYDGDSKRSVLYSIHTNGTFTPVVDVFAFAEDPPTYSYGTWVGKTTWSTSSTGVWATLKSNLGSGANPPYIATSLQSNKIVDNSTGDDCYTAQATVNSSELQNRYFVSWAIDSEVPVIFRSDRTDSESNIIHGFNHEAIKYDSATMDWFPIGYGYSDAFFSTRDSAVTLCPPGGPYSNHILMDMKKLHLRDDESVNMYDDDDDCVPGMSSTVISPAYLSGSDLHIPGIKTQNLTSGTEYKAVFPSTTSFSATVAGSSRTYASNLTNYSQVDIDEHFTSASNALYTIAHVAEDQSGTPSVNAIFYKEASDTSASTFASPVEASFSSSGFGTFLENTEKTVVSDLGSLKHLAITHGPSSNPGSYPDDTLHLLHCVYDDSGSGAYDLVHREYAKVSGSYQEIDATVIINDYPVPFVGLALAHRTVYNSMTPADQWGYVFRDTYSTSMTPVYWFVAVYEDGSYLDHVYYTDAYFGMERFPSYSPRIDKIENGNAGTGKGETLLTGLWIGDDFHLIAIQDD